jgi:hypothetical protein
VREREREIEGEGGGGEKGREGERKICNTMYMHTAAVCCIAPVL